MKKILKLIIISLITLICPQYSFAYSNSEHSISSEELDILSKLDLDSFWKPNSKAIKFSSLESKYTKKAKEIKSDYAELISILNSDDSDVARVEICNKLVKKYPVLAYKFPFDGSKEEIAAFLKTNLEDKGENFSNFQSNRYDYERIFKKIDKTFSLYKISSYNDLNSYNSRYAELLHKANSNLERAEKAKNAKDGKVSQYSMTGTHINNASTRERGRKEYEEISTMLYYIENYKKLGDLILEKLPEEKDLVINLEDKNKRSFDCYLIDANSNAYVVLSLNKKKIYNIKRENLSANCLKDLNNLDLKEITLFDFLVKLAENGDAERQYKLGDLYLNGNGVKKKPKYSQKLVHKVS